MGWKKWIKRTIKKVTKPISKVFKGVAKGIAKVGKSVMRGVAKLSKKLGPLGMIAMSIAMPYALGGLSSMVGTMGVPQLGIANTGLLGSSNAFLRAVGTVGNQIRTGYQTIGNIAGKVTSKVGEKLSTMGNSITNTITKTFQKFGGNASGDNFWTRISKGAKNLFNSAKSVVTGQQKVGTTGVKDWGNPFGYADTSQMTSRQAVGLLESGAIEGSQLSGQTLGFATNTSDKLITETINKASQNTVNMLDKNSLRYYNDLKGTGQFTNNQEILDVVLENQGTRYQGLTDFDGVYNTDLTKTGDYKIGTTQPGKATEYSFTGDSTFDNPVSNKLKVKEKIKKVAKKKALGIVKNYLFAPSEIIEPEAYQFQPTAAAESNENIGAALSSTDVKGSSGSSSYANVFGTEAWEKLKNYHRNMNYQGSMDYYG